MSVVKHDVDGVRDIVCAARTKILADLAENGGVREFFADRAVAEIHEMGMQFIGKFHETGHRSLFVLFARDRAENERKDHADGANTPDDRNINVPRHAAVFREREQHDEADHEKNDAPHEKSGLPLVILIQRVVDQVVLIVLVSLLREIGMHPLHFLHVGQALLLSSAQFLFNCIILKNSFFSSLVIPRFHQYYRGTLKESR